MREVSSEGMTMARRPEHQGVRKAVDEVFGKENVKEGEDMVWYVEVR
jgi:hypothetical protein